MQKLEKIIVFPCLLLLLNECKIMFFSYNFYETCRHEFNFTAVGTVRQQYEIVYRE